TTTPAAASQPKTTPTKKQKTGIKNKHAIEFTNNTHTPTTTKSSHQGGGRRLIGGPSSLPSGPPMSNQEPFDSLSRPRLRIIPCGLSGGDE
ncbi:MAG: hypothetical protein LKI58_13450, partial [Actinomyces sp.]